LATWVLEAVGSWVGVGPEEIGNVHSPLLGLRFPWIMTWSFLIICRRTAVQLIGESLIEGCRRRRRHVRFVLGEKVGRITGGLRIWWVVLCVRWRQLRVVLTMWA
jgi:hypothetical protein